MLRTILSIAMLCPPGALAQSAPLDPMTLRAHDTHQSMTIAADPYLKPERYTKDLFGKDSPFAAGIIAIDVYFRNENSVPVRLNPETIQLVISQPGQERQRINLLSPEEVADRTLLTANANIRQRRPFPFPGSSSTTGHSKNWTEMTTTLRSIALGTDILPPHATTHGFLFFDMNHDIGAIRNTHLYIPDLAFMTDNKALFFFEIDLGDAPLK